MIYLGIDIGLDGAVALLLESGVYCTRRVPTRKITSGKRTKRIYDDEALFQYLGELRSTHRMDLAMLENVHAMPGQGVSSTFSLGVGLGTWRALLTALAIPMAMVEPVVWKRRYGLIGKDKEDSIVTARRLFPGQLAETITDGQAEAVLIAAYARDTWGKDR